MASTSEDAKETETKAILVSGNEFQNTAPMTNVGWIHDMTHFLQIGECPLGLDRAKRRYFILQSIPFVLVEGILFRKDINGVLLRYIDSDQIEKVLHEFHDGTLGGHFAPRKIA